MQKDFPQITKVKGIGLMVGCELSMDAASIVEYCLQQQVLINAVGGKIFAVCTAFNSHRRGN